MRSHTVHQRHLVVPSPWVPAGRCPAPFLLQAVMTLRVFLIEDNPTIRDLLVGLLEDSTPCEVIAMAESEDEARRWLARNGEGWDLLVADLFLTEGSGMEVVKACADRLPHQRVVVLTNYAEAANDRALSQGADAVFDKTGQFEDFLAYASELAEAGTQGR